MEGYCVNHIQCDYGAKRVIRDLSCQIGSGRITGILGPNGSGKTTVLKALLRLIPLAAGSIDLDGRSLSSFSQVEFARKVAYVSQSVGDIDDYTVEDLLRMGRYPYQGVSDSTRDEVLLQRIADQMGIAALRYRWCHELSGGELQRVMIGRALMQEPSFLLLDEPTSSLDIAGINALALLLKSLVRDSNAGFVVVSHELNFLQAICDDLLLFSNGALLAAGPLSDVLTHDLLTQVFGPLSLPWLFRG